MPGHMDRVIARIGETAALRSVFISPRFGYVYVNNQKAACSTIKLALYRAELGDPDWAPRASIHQRERAIIPGPAELDPMLVEQMLGGSAFRFTVVRDPYTRALSAYRDKFERLNAPDPEVPVYATEANRQRLRESFGVSSDADLERFGFGDFLEAIRAEDPAELDPHWRPQVVNTCVDVVDYDLVGRVESLAEALAQVAAATGVPRLAATPLNVTGADRVVGEYYDRSLVSLVDEIYRDDFDRFGYERGWPVH